MAISIDWGTKVISVPQSDLTLVSGVKYTLDVDVFRLALKDLEDSEAGMPFDKTHNHNTTVTVGGVTLARVVEIINGYTISFEDTGTPYQVRLEGANNNILDVANIVANVNIASTNSAGLIQVDGGGGSAPTASQNAAAVWNSLLTSHTTSGTFGAFIQKLLTVAKFLGLK